MVDITNPVNWTVKVISGEAKEHALAQAKAAGIPVGLWLEKLLLAHRSGHSDGASGHVSVDLKALAEIMRAAADIMQASGKPIPKGAVSNAFGLMTHELRARRQELPKQPARRRDHSAASAISGSGARSDVGASDIGNSDWRGSTPAIANSDN